MKIVKSIVQIGYLYILLLIGNTIARLLHLPIPGSIIGLVLLFLLLQFHIIKLEWIELGAAVLLSELLLFFIPSAIGVIDYHALFGARNEGCAGHCCECNCGNVCNGLYSTMARATEEG